MKPTIIRLTVAEAPLHVNASQIAYYFSKTKEDGKIVTVIQLVTNHLVEVEEALSEVDVLIEAASL